MKNVQHSNNEIWRLEFSLSLQMLILFNNVYGEGKVGNDSVCLVKSSAKMLAMYEAHLEMIVNKIPYDGMHCKCVKKLLTVGTHNWSSYVIAYHLVMWYLPC
jgi:hypothetical protein